jgi:hypothetical protein
MDSEIRSYLSDTSSGGGAYLIDNEIIRFNNNRGAITQPPPIPSIITTAPRAFIPPATTRPRVIP